MSDRSRQHPRRSVLAVPGSSERFLAKAPHVGADMVMLDLEDAVVPSERARARRLVARAVAAGGFGDAIVGVRVNAFGTGDALADLTAVVPESAGRLDVVVLAKTKDAAEVRALDIVLGELERAAGLTVGGIGVEALLESAKGIANIAEIAAASSRLEALCVGPGDLAASLGMAMGTVGDVLDGYPGDHYHAVSMALIVAARANGLACVDGPYLGLDDEGRLRELAGRTRALGFDGKWAIHPSQVPVLNEVYAPTDAEVARAHEMLAALDDAAATEQRGAVRHGAEMFDEVNRKMAESILARRPDAT